MKAELNEAEMTAITNALSIAAGQYLTDAAAGDNANQPRLAEQFRRQARFARQLRTKLENADEPRESL